MHVGIIALFLSLALPSVGFAANERIDDNSAEAEQSQHPAATQDPAIPDLEGREFFSKIPSGPLQHILESLEHAIVFGSAQKKYRDDYNFWEKVALLHAPGLIKNERLFEKFRENHEGPAQPLRDALLITLYMKNNLSKMIQESGRSLAYNAELLARIDAAYTPEFARGIRGGFMLMAGNFDGGIALLNQPGTVVTEGMQKALNGAAYDCRLGFNRKTGREYLKRIAGDVSNPGRQHAQEKLNWAAYDRRLGFNRNFRAEKSGYNYLVKIAGDVTNPGRKHAQERLNQAAEYGRLGLGREYLEGIAGDVDNPGRQHAQEKLNWAARDGKLNFNKTGRQYLQDRVLKGDAHAQERLDEAEQSSEFRFCDGTDRAYLEHIADDVTNPGRQNAQERLNQAAYSRILGVTDVKECRQYLEKRAYKGDAHAQGLLNHAARLGKLEFTPETGRAYLEDRAYKGDAHAQERLNEAAKEGKLGFKKYTNLGYFFAAYNALTGGEQPPFLGSMSSLSSLQEPRPPD